MDDDQQFCLRWNNHQSTLISVFDTLLENGTLVDCTLAAEGKFLKAHKVVLCACSPYFASLLSQQYDKHPIFILKDVKFQELRAMMDYMYRGEVNISQDQLAALLKAAESLQIKGLSDNRSGGSSQKDLGSATQQKQTPVPVGAGSTGTSAASKGGLTIEQHKRPLKHIVTDAELSGSREGSTSPTSRKRKKLRRRSIDTNNAIDNHDQMSNSSSQSQQSQQPIITSTPLALSQITTATSAANVLNVTKKTDETQAEQRQPPHNGDDDEQDGEDSLEQDNTPAGRHKDNDGKDKTLESELMIEPKSEYEDGNDETVEDLTMDDEDLLEDLDQAGPSHGGEGSSQGYAQWQVDRSQDEVFLAAQDAAGQHRDAQDNEIWTEEVVDSSEKGFDKFEIIELPDDENDDPLMTALLFNDELSDVSKIHRCKLCKSQFSSLDALKYHQRIGCTITIISDQCHTCACGEKFPNRVKLLQHRYRCSVLNKDLMHKCPRCPYRSKRRADVRRHMNTRTCKIREQTEQEPTEQEWK